MPFNINTARHHFRFSYFARGQRYKKNVVELTVRHGEKNSCHIKAFVKGSLPTPYEVNINVNIKSSSVEGICDCPVHFNCKHVAAAVLVANERDLFEPTTQEERERLEVDAWFNRIEQHESQKRLEEKRPQQHQFFYSIFPGQKSGQFYLSIKTRRKLLRGGYGKEYIYRPSKYFSRHDLPNYATEEDAEIIELFSRI